MWQAVPRGSPVAAGSEEQGISVTSMGQGSSSVSMCSSYLESAKYKDRLAAQLDITLASMQSKSTSI